MIIPRLRSPMTDHRRTAVSRAAGATAVCAVPGVGVIYQYNFNPPCIWRGALAWLVTLPKALLFRLVLGPPKTTRLNTLNASARKSARKRSVTRKVLARLTFSLNE